MTFYYNALDENCKNVTGGVRQGEELKISLISNATKVILAIKCDKNGKIQHHEMQKTDGGFTVLLSTLKSGLYFYYFIADGVEFYRGADYKAQNSELNGESDLFQLLVYSNSYKPPQWLSGGVIYQIFPDRFCRAGNETNQDGKIMRIWGEMPYYKSNERGKILNNDFFGGNFEGIKSKLEYLKELGVTLIYLNPISLAYSNHRYDTADYFKIDGLLGSEKDFKSLIDCAHENGIKIMLDGVYNHTGDDSVYFNKYNTYSSIGAYQSKESPYYKWYSFKKYPNDYESWWGIDVLPSINKKSKEFQEFIVGENGVLAHYFRLGIDGIRLDVVDELSPEFVKKIRKIAKKINPNAIVLGEVWEDATNKIAYGVRREYFLGEELDSVMNYPLKDGIINFLLTKNAQGLKDIVNEQINNYPNSALNLLMNLLGSHDTARILTVLSGVQIPKTREERAKLKLDKNGLEKAYIRLKQAVVLLYTLYGVPSIYYGDERLTEGAPDPFNRTCINWQFADEELLNFYKKLGKIRCENDVFKNGKTQVIIAENGVFAFRRHTPKNEIFVAVNTGEYTYQISSKNKLKNLLTNCEGNSVNLEKGQSVILQNCK